MKPKKWTMERLLRVIRGNGGEIQVHRYQYRKDVVGKARKDGLVSCSYTRDFINVRLWKCTNTQN
nr:MAG TPA: hypothetical protein [Caudoviricetes sp.]